MRILFGFILLTAIVAHADMSAVAVPATMLHGPGSAMGLGYSGKVEYTLAPGENDSVYVTLSIIPAAGGQAIALTEVSGDVGAIRVNTNLPATVKIYSIFFQTSAAQTGVQYIARVTANAAVTASKTKVEGYIASMTKTQKATLCQGSGFVCQGAGPIPGIYCLDGPHGVRNWSTTLFPTCCGEACTWDTALAIQQGQAKGEEFRSCSSPANASLGPALDLVYHPQGGRASEYYSEDPFLSGRMAAYDVLGLQSRGVAGVIKHFACNNKEDNRYNLSASMNERSMREIYLYNWKPCVVRAQCWGVMSAYNRLSTPAISYAGSNKFIQTDVLRNEWGYAYLVMTDWTASFDNLNAGMQWGADIQMPDPSVYTIPGVTGQSDSIVNMHARRIMHTHIKLGDLAAGYNRAAYASTMMSAAHKQVVRDVGSAGIILARNNGNILPLPKTGARIAVTGPFRNVCRLGPGGSSELNPLPANRITPIQGMTALLAGVGAGASTIQDNNTAGANYIVVFVGVTGETEGGDRPNLTVQGGDGDNDAQAALNVTTAKTIVVFTGGSAASAGNWSRADAIVIAFYPGEQQGNSIADVLFGNVNPSGKLPVTFPKDAGQLPPFNLVGTILNYPRSDTAHGYFRVNKMGVEPLFNFGHGLSYTTFSYANLRMFPAAISAGDRVHVKVDVTNTGAVAGKEVVQLYLSMPYNVAGLPVRVQDLRGFSKLDLSPGQTKTAAFELTAEDMQVWDPRGGADYSGTGAWRVLTGTYGVRVGTSSQRDLQPTASGNFVVQ